MSRKNRKTCRRNALSIVPTKAKNALQQDDEGSRCSPAFKTRIMSVSDETSQPRMKKTLNKFHSSSIEEEATLNTRLTEAQISAFREVFDLFDSNGGGTISAEELDAALRSVGMCLSEDDIIGVLESMDRDGNGEIDFVEFLNLMTNTEKFLESIGGETNNNVEADNKNREVMLFDALTQFMKNSALHSMDEIVGYFQSKYRRFQAPHVVGHYAAGARSTGLTEKQIQRHMDKIRASNADSTSPYAQPLYNLIPSSAQKRAPIDAAPLTKCWRKGKIQLNFNIDDVRRRSIDDNADANHVAVSKSAAELSGSLTRYRVGAKPRPPKCNGWVLSKATESMRVHLPTVPLSPKKGGVRGKRAPLTFDDLPDIRRKVEKAKIVYYKQVDVKKRFEAKQHWDSLNTEFIASEVCRERFCRVFQTYMGVTTR